MCCELCREMDDISDRCIGHPKGDGTKILLATITAVTVLAGGFSAACAADDKKLTPQAEKMKACNAQAVDKKGDER